MVEDTQRKMATIFESKDANIVNEMQRSVVALPEKKEKEINRNKPWRIVIRRNVVDGGSAKENIC